MCPSIYLIALIRLSIQFFYLDHYCFESLPKFYFDRNGKSLFLYEDFLYTVTPVPKYLNLSMYMRRQF